MRVLPSIHVSVLISLAACGPAEVDPSSSADTAAEPVPLLEEAVDLPGLHRHLDALQDIADAHAGNRAGASAGYAASADYAATVLEDAGYDVTWFPFTYVGWEELGPPVLQSTDGAYTAASGELAALWFSPAGDVTAPLHPVDLVLPPSSSSSSTSGCEPSDFDGLPAGAVALLQRGTCTFATKVLNAEDAGAVGVVVFNEGQSGRRDVERWVLDEEDPPTIPVLGASYAVGEALAALVADRAAAGAELEVHLVVLAETATHTSHDLIAETAGGDPGRVVVVGAHLDSVTAGPGINDNGSGTAMVLELAVRAAELGLEPVNKLRFALWGAEELGLVGSQRYLDDLADDELDAILANLNYDMVGSPNGVRFVYDGDGSAYGIAGPAGSDVIEDLHTEWFESQGLAWEETLFDGRSDYFGFIARGIPAGGLFSGAEVAKTADEATVYGGTAGVAHDACYHQGCDTRENVDDELFLELVRAGAHATRRLAEREEALGDEGGARRAWSERPAPVAGVHSCHGDRPVER